MSSGRAVMSAVPSCSCEAALWYDVIIIQQSRPLPQLYTSLFPFRDIGLAPSPSRDHKIIRRN